MGRKNHFVGLKSNFRFDKNSLVGSSGQSRPTSGLGIQLSKLVDGRRRVQSPIALAVRSIPWFSPKFS